jgi:hypothetical protein
MGLFQIKCWSCQKPFMWFSGNRSQLCIKCEPPKPVEIKQGANVSYTMTVNDPHGDRVKQLEALLEAKNLTLLRTAENLELIAELLDKGEARTRLLKTVAILRSKKKQRAGNRKSRARVD